jgi:6-pyruvoyltetrahydropterin/6-carboxytetrahydropterin synthase
MVPDGHKCKRLHGHNYVVELSLTGPINDDGFVIDFWELDDIMKPLLSIVDHTYLNGHADLENPTAENIALWFAGWFVHGKGSTCARLAKRECTVTKITVFETPECSATYYL